MLFNLSACSRGRAPESYNVALFSRPLSLLFHGISLSPSYLPPSRNHHLLGPNFCFLVSLSSPCSALSLCPFCFCVMEVRSWAGQPGAPQVGEEGRDLCLASPLWSRQRAGGAGSLQLGNCFPTDANIVVVRVSGRAGDPLAFLSGCDPAAPCPATSYCPGFLSAAGAIAISFSSSALMNFPSSRFEAPLACDGAGDYLEHSYGRVLPL